jgi:hypothetical protein
MLSGHPFAGKSMLVSGLLEAIGNAEPFLGRSTRAASALLISEEDDTVMRNRAELFDLFGSPSEFIGRGDSLLLDWPQLIATATARALEQGHALLVFDTFAGLAGLGDEQENDAGAITHKLRPLREAAANGLAVLFLHHMNGYGQPRGSKAFRASVDVSVRLLRQSATTRVFRLESESRFAAATPARLRAELVMSGDRWSYQPLQTRTRGPIGTTSDDLLMQALLGSERGCLSYSELNRIEGLSADIGKRRLPRWFEANRVGRRGRGTKTDPYCWYPLAA